MFFLEKSFYFNNFFSNFMYFSLNRGPNATPAYSVRTMEMSPNCIVMKCMNCYNDKYT